MITKLLQPVSSISTYGKIITSASKGAVRKKETRELLINEEEEEEERRKARESELAKEPTVPRSTAIFSSFQVRNAAKASPCFLNKGKQCDRNAAKGGAEATPPPSHYNPKHTLTKQAAPKYSVPRPQTAMSRKHGDDTASQKKNDEGWSSKLHSTVCVRPQSAMAATPSRTDRLNRSLSPWLKNHANGQTSAFRGPERTTPMSKECRAELADPPNIDLIRPRSAMTVNITNSIGRAQRDKTAPEGKPCGAYTLQLSYNKDLDNDAPTRRGIRKMSNGRYGPGANVIRMEHQVSRKGIFNDEGFVKTPGLEKLGLNQAVWGSNDGWAGGTEQVLTTKRSPFTKMNHIDRRQHEKTGHNANSSDVVDVIYEAKPQAVQKRSSMYVDIGHQPQRETFSNSGTDAPDQTYEWTHFIDKRQVPAPNIKLQPDREMRAKQGYGSKAAPAVDALYNHHKIQAAINTRAKGVDIERVTSRDPPTMIEPEAYKDQITAGKAIRSIGEIPQSPVFGKSPLVPDMGGKSKRFPHHAKAKQKQGFML